MPPDVKGKCPGGEAEWQTFDDQCIAFYKDETKLHRNSTEHCKSLHKAGQLPSIHSDAENWLMREQYREGVLPWGWIGLYRRPGGKF